MEHRWGQRFSVDMPVKLGTRSALMGSGRIIDISMSGAFVVTLLRPPLFGHVEVDVPDFKGQEFFQRLAGFVVRHDSEGIGVEWNQFGPAQIAALLEHFAPERVTSLSVAVDQYRRTALGRARP
jgi:hypothetical protein